MNWNAVGTVVVPIDLEDANDVSLKTALQAATSKAGVHIVYVLPQLEPSLMVQIDVASRRANAKKSLDTWIEEQGATGVTAVVLVGPPASAIVEHAASSNADLVVLQARRHRALGRVLIGSVAERVSRHSPCPVLLLRMPPA